MRLRRRARFAFVRTDEGIAIRVPDSRLGPSKLVYVIREQKQAILEATDPLHQKDRDLPEVGRFRGVLTGSQRLQQRRVLHVLKDLVLDLAANAHRLSLRRKGRA